MKLFLITNPYCSYGPHITKAVVIAEDEEQARRTHPHKFVWSDVDRGWSYESGGPWYGTEWCRPNSVKVEYLGEAKEGSTPGTLCYSWDRGYGGS